MSREIDERVVEMRFDNKQFEKNAKETMTTLERLKAALNMSSSTKTLDNFKRTAQSISVDKISSGIEALTNRFSTLGIVGMRVIENITDAAMNKLAKAVGFVTDSIVSGGIRRATNIENAHFQLQALLKDEAKVQAVMDDAMESVDGTAYAYDEAAKAASQFAASGVQAGEDMLNALKGITGVAAMTNSDFESISRIFTTVAGNGRLMGDQLLQLSSRGLNAASTMVDYFKEVRGQSSITEAEVRDMVSKGKISFKDFSDAMTWAFGDSAKRANETFTGSFANMKSALARIGAEFVSPLIEQNSELVKMFNALRIKINDVKGALTFNAQKSAISGLGAASKLTEEELTSMFDTIKERGHASMDDFKFLEHGGVKSIGALTKYLNGVTDGSIRASYAVTTAVAELTDGVQVSQSQVRKYINEGKIDLTMFTNAMETEYGNLRGLSKQFTDFVLDNIKRLTNAINNADLTKPLEGFYYTVEIIKNALKGLYSFVKPIGQAFSEVFFVPENGEGLLNLLADVELLTENFRLSEKGAKNLKDAFGGVFSVVKLLINGVTALVRVFFPMLGPVEDVGDGFLSLAGAMGRSLTTFTEWVRTAPGVRRAYDALGTVVGWTSQKVRDLIASGKQSLKAFSEIPFVQKLIRSLEKSVEDLVNEIGPFLENIPDNLRKFRRELTNLIPDEVQTKLHSFAKALKDVFGDINSWEFTSISELFDLLIEKFKKLYAALMSNEGIYAFVTNMKQFFKDLQDAFTLDNLFEKIDKAREVLTGWIDWVKDVFGKSFEDFSLGGTLAAGSGIGIIYALIQAAKGLNNLSGSLSAIPNFFKSLSSTLVAMQNDLKANSILKIAGAIGILAVSLTIMSFADIDRLVIVGTGLAAFVYIVGGVVKKIAELKGSGKTIENILLQLAKGFKKGIKNFSKAAKWKAIGGMFKSFALSVGIIIASIAGIGYMYSKDAEGVKMGITVVRTITKDILIIMVGLSALGSVIENGMNAFANAASGVMQAAIAVGICVGALWLIMKMELPTSDFGKRIGLLIGMFFGVGFLIEAIAVASRIAGTQKIRSGPLIGAALSMIVITEAVKRLFQIDMSENYYEKLGALIWIFVGLGSLIAVVGAVSKKSQGALKAAGTIIAMAAFVGVAVGALYVLKDFPGKQLFKAVIALGLVLGALGAALYGAGKITEKANWKSVLAMAFNLGVIVAALGIISMIPVESLAKSVIAIGATLLAMAQAFKGAGTVTDQISFASIIAMIASVLGISYSLFILSSQPWDQMLAAGGSIAAVLLSIAGVLMILGKVKVDQTQLLAFGVGVLALIPAAVAIGILSSQPWQQMLAAAASMAIVLIGVSSALLIASFANINPITIVAFAAGCVALIPAAFALSLIAGEDWGGIIAAAAGLAIACVAIAGTLLLLGLNPVNVAGVLSFVIAAVALIPIAYAIKILADLPFEKVVQGLITLAGGLAIIAVAGLAFGAMSPMMIAGAAALLLMSVAVAGAGAAVLAFVVCITSALDILGKFIAGVGEGLGSVLEAGKNIVAGLIEGIVSGIKTIATVAIEIGKTFINSVKDFFGINSPSKLMEEIASYITKGFTNGLEDGAPEIFSVAKSVFGGITDVIDVNGLAKTGKDMASSFSLGFGSMKEDIKAQAKRVTDGTDLQTDTTAYTQAGQQASSSFANGFEMGSFDMQAMMEEAMSGMGLDFDYSKYMDFGGMASGNFMEGFSTGNGEFGDMSSYISNIMSGAPENADLSSYFSVGEDGGNQFLDGFQAGSTNRIPVVVSEVVQFLADTISQHSEFMDFTSVGKMIVEKITKPIGDSKAQVLTAITLFVNNVSSAFQNNENILKAKGAQSAAVWLSGFKSKGGEAKTAGILFASKVIEGLVSKSQEFNMKGLDVSNRFIQGIRNKFGEAMATGANLSGRTVQGIYSKSTEFLSVSMNLGGQYARGIQSRSGDALNAGRSLAQAALNAVSGMYNAFYNAGSNAGAGFANGLRSQISAAQAAAAALSNVASSVPKKVLKIKSPSRVLMEIGKFVSLGFAQGISDNIGVVESSAGRTANGALEAMKAAISSITDIVTSEDFDMNPVITPTLDLTGVREGVDDVARLFNDAVNASSIQVQTVGASFRNPRSQYQNNPLDDHPNPNALMVQNGPENQPVVQQNTFYITGDDPQAIAEEVSNILQKQVERKEAVWGS